jgi:SNF2 family DNA or RNA helicase
MYNEFGSRALAEYVQKWGHSYVLYDGTPTQMQSAQDRFREDPSIKVFISSDKGSDSINLEQATSVINYDLPWKYSTLLQRVNRINRITSTASHVWYYNLIMVSTMEERKQEILERKRLMAEAIDDPTAEVMEAILSMTASDYRYILTGEKEQ